jgi:hypothetical protein
MIIRAWRAVADLGATLARKVRAEDNELVVMSFWADIGSATGFGKGEFDDAVVKPSTQKLLKSFDLKVEYFDTIVSTGVLSGHDSAGPARA